MRYIFVTYSLSTKEKVRIGMHYADWKPAITTSELDSIMWTFSPGHAGILGNKRADVLVGSAEIRGTIIMDPPAVRAAVQEVRSFVYP